jgi:hypothetical protein
VSANTKEEPRMESPNYAVLPGEDLDEGLSVLLARALAGTCECEASDHWREHSNGSEVRIDCGCPCAECSEY